jgi:hypothetical protein
MRKYILALSLVLLAASCAKQPVFISTPPTQTATSTPVDTANWNSFQTNPNSVYASDLGIHYTTYNLSFKYPSDWQQSAQNNNPRAVVELYDYKSAEAMQSCLDNSTTDSNTNEVPQCGQEVSNYEIALFPDQYVDYDSLDSTLKSNYPGYQKLNINGLDVFSYQPDAVTVAYHVNFPDKSTGVYFTSFPDGDETDMVNQVLAQIMQTVTLTPTPAPPYSAAQLSVKYTNSLYGFIFSLPSDWKGFTTYTKSWTGSDIYGNQNVASGTIIFLRNPNWTQKDPYEDIPVYVFTHSQWQDVLGNNMNADLLIFAAPVGPTELGRNNNYIFALPPRYDWDYSTGYQEVEQIMQSNPLKGY